MKILTGLWKLILNFQKAIMIVSTFLILLGLAAVIYLRYVAKTDLFGIEELIIIPCIWIYFMGASYASYEKSHITADILNSYISNRKWRSLINVIKGCISLIIVTIVTYWSLQFLLWGISSSGQTPVWKIPMYVSILAVFLGFLFMLMYSIYHFVLDIKEFLIARKPSIE